MATYKWLDKAGVAALWEKIKALVGTKADASDVYTKTEIDNMLKVGIKYEVVDSLPEEDIKEGTIYLVSNGSETEKNIYDEYMYVNNTWEKIGTTATDLDGYVKKEEGKGLSTNDFTDELKEKLEGINTGLSTATETIELAPAFGDSDEKTLTITANDGTEVSTTLKITLPEETVVDVPVKGITLNGEDVNPDENGIVALITPESPVTDVLVKHTGTESAVSVVDGGIATIDLTAYQPAGDYVKAEDLEAITDEEIDEICDLPAQPVV